MNGSREHLLDLYLPWNRYNWQITPRMATRYTYSHFQFPDWTTSVTKYHPAPERLTSAAFNLMARNYGIFTHPTLADLAIAFPGTATGGTDQSIRIAQDLKIPLLVWRSNQVLNEQKIQKEVLTVIEALEGAEPK